MPLARDAVTVRDDNLGAIAVCELQAARLTASGLMKLCVDPESRRAVKSWAPIVTRSCMVSRARMPVTADSEIIGFSGSNAGCSVGGSSSGSSGSSTI